MLIKTGNIVILLSQKILSFITTEKILSVSHHIKYCNFLIPEYIAIFSSKKIVIRSPEKILIRSLQNILSYILSYHFSFCSLWVKVTKHLVAKVSATLGKTTLSTWNIMLWVQLRRYSTYLHIPKYNTKRTNPKTIRWEYHSFIFYLFYTYHKTQTNK